MLGKVVRFLLTVCVYLFAFQLSAFAQMPDQVNSEIDLYYSRSLQEMLDSAEGRLHVLERDIEILMYGIQADVPQAPAYKRIALSVIVLPTEPVTLPPPNNQAELPLANYDDVTVAQLNQQLLMILQTIQTLQHKLSWIQQVYRLPSGRLQPWYNPIGANRGLFTEEYETPSYPKEYSQLRHRLQSIIHTADLFLTRFYTPNPPKEKSAEL
jgi:hypothetical protein